MTDIHGLGSINTQQQLQKILDSHPGAAITATGENGKPISPLNAATIWSASEKGPVKILLKSGSTMETFTVIRGNQVIDPSQFGRKTIDNPSGTSENIKQTHSEIVWNDKHTSVTRDGSSGKHLHVTQLTNSSFTGKRLDTGAEETQTGVVTVRPAMERKLALYMATRENFIHDMSVKFGSGFNTRAEAIAHFSTQWNAMETRYGGPDGFRHILEGYSANVADNSAFGVSHGRTASDRGIKDANGDRAFDTAELIFRPGSELNPALYVPTTETGDIDIVSLNEITPSTDSGTRRLPDVPPIRDQQIARHQPEEWTGIQVQNNGSFRTRFSAEVSRIDQQSVSYTDSNGKPATGTRLTIFYTLTDNSSTINGEKFNMAEADKKNPTTYSFSVIIPKKADGALHNPNIVVLPGTNYISGPKTMRYGDSYDYQQRQVEITRTVCGRENLAQMGIKFPDLGMITPTALGPSDSHPWLQASNSSVTYGSQIDPSILRPGAIHNQGEAVVYTRGADNVAGKKERTH